MFQRLRRFGNWFPWAISGLGLVCVVGAYFLDPDMERYSFWLTVLTSGGIALALAAPVTMLTRNLADDIAVDVADANALEEEDIVDAIEERSESPDVRETPDRHETPVTAAESYPELSEFLKGEGWSVTSSGAMHEVWRNGRDRVVIPRTPRNPGRVYDQVRRNTGRGRRPAPFRGTQPDVSDGQPPEARRRRTSDTTGGRYDGFRGRPSDPTGSGESASTEDS